MNVTGHLNQHTLSWKDKYYIASPNLGGGQGNCYIVKEKISGGQFFLKTLKDNSSERRSRFFRETVLFKSLNIDGVPKIIETNVEKFKTNEDLYYCAELITGSRLDLFVNNTKPNENQIINLFRQLLTILQKCHKEEVVHRDVKPENIIIDQSRKLYLVDFGISVLITDKDKLTKTGQELGNRFLRLPEFSAGSSSKRDARSDLTLACGIALYLISKVYPRNLVNDKGNFPHQTPESIKAISALKHSIVWNIIFDRGFQQDMSKRWSSTTDIQTILNMIENKKEDDSELESYLQIHANSIQIDYNLLLKQAITNIYNEIKRNIYSVLLTKAKGFRTEEESWVYQLGDTLMKCQIRAYPIGRRVHVPFNVIAQMIGEQVIGLIEINDNVIEICRVKSENSLSELQMQNMNNMITHEVIKSLVGLLKK